MKTLLIIIATAICLSACNKTAKEAIQLPNPASVKCIEDGYRLEIRKDESDNEYGVCIDEEGSECEEWKYFRGECFLKK